MREGLWVESGGGDNVVGSSGNVVPWPGVEGLSLSADRADNVNGAELLGFKRSDNALAGLTGGEVLIIANEELVGVSADAVSKADAVIVIGTVLPKSVTTAATVLPIATFAEEEGTFTNLRGRVQRFLQAKATPGHARPSWYVLSDLLTACGETSEFFTASAAFDALAKNEPAFNGLSYDSLGLKGAVIAGAMAGAK